MSARRAVCATMSSPVVATSAPASVNVVTAPPVVASGCSAVSRHGFHRAAVTVTRHTPARTRRAITVGRRGGGASAGMTAIVPPTGVVALTAVSYGDRWLELPPERYVEAKNALASRLIDLADRVAPGIRDHIEVVEVASTIELPGSLADHVTHHLPIDPHVKQSVLEIIDHQERLERVHYLVANEVEILELDQRLRARVRQQMDRNQREYYLKEQLKAIHEELGHDPASEVAELRQKAAEKGLPEVAATRFQRELSRLERLPSSSPEGNIIRTYLELILALPWNERTEDRTDVDYAQQVLDEDHYGLDKVKERIIEFLAVRQLLAKERPSGGIKGPILCFIGPPGVGKTSLGKSIARALGRKFVRLSLGGVRDEAEIRGHRRTYVGALPGRILQAMRTAGCRNPVILLDEIDKLSSDFRGDPAAALLEVLDPEQNHSFSDHYLDLPYDLSEVMFIATANYQGAIPRPLLDRMEVLEIGGYTETEKMRIARGYLLPKQLHQHGLSDGQLVLSDRVLRRIIQQYTREAGVRNL
ncbi:MAG: AAA family ATPase, partial [Candidatus Rokubacteria bacterium]|nr:AAA family ATPase [Candidatus Rokubacteria bacterium]